MPGGGGVLDPILQKYMEQMRRQRFFDTIGQIGQGMIAAGGRGAGFGNALAQGLANAGGGRGRGGGNDMLDMLRLQGTLDRRRQDQEAQRRARGQHAASEALGAGDRYDPKTEILWNTPPAPSREPAALTSEQRESLLARAYPAAVGKARVAEAFPAPVEYSAPTTVMGPDNKPMLVRFPKKGAGAPAEVAGYQPYTKPGEGPASVELANAWRKANKDAGIDVSMRDALQWAKTSVGKSPDAIFLSVYNSLLRGFLSPEEAKSTATEMTKHVLSLRGGAAQSPPLPAAVPGGAQAATQPGAVGPPLASVSPTPGGLGPGEYPPYPQRKPSLEGVKLPLSTGGETSLEIDAPARPLPKTADGKVDAARLEVGQLYEAADLTWWRWDGQGFTEATE
jgi:hypothetical protein